MTAIGRALEGTVVLDLTAHPGQFMLADMATLVEAARMLVW